MKISKEAKIAFLFLLSSVILYFGFHYLKGVDFLSSTYTYYTVVERSNGLEVSNRVVINDFGVGRVAKIAFAPRLGNRLLVTLEIKKDILLREGSTAVISDFGLLGDKVVVLNVAQAGKVLAEGDTLQGSVDAGMMGAVSAKAAPIMDKVDSSLHHVNLLLQEYKGMGEDVRELVANSKNAAANANALIAENRATLNKTLANVNALTASLVQTEAQLKPLIGKMNTFADSLNALQLAATVLQAKATLTELKVMMEAVNQQKGTAGKILYDPELYTNLNQTLRDLDALLVGFNENPRYYFAPFGKKPKDKEKKKQ